MLGLLVGIMGDLDSIMFRLDISNSVSIAKDVYNLSITVHGIVMIFIVSMGSLLSAIGNIYNVVLIGIVDVAYTRNSILSVVVLPIAVLIMLLASVDSSLNGCGWTTFSLVTVHDPPLPTPSLCLSSFSVLLLL